MSKITYKGWLVVAAVVGVTAFYYLSNDAHELMNLTVWTGTVTSLVACALPFALLAIFGFFIIESWWRR